MYRQAMDSLSRLRYSADDHLINVSTDCGLTRPSHAYRSPSPTQTRLISELQEQIRSYKKDLTKKDELINELAIGSPRLDARRLDDCKCHVDVKIPRESALFREHLPPYRISAESSNTEFAVAQRKIENLTVENRDLHARLATKEKLLREQKYELETSKENAARQSALLQSLRDRVRIAEDSSGTLETVTTRGTITIQSLQKDNREAHDRILELEARIRSHLAEREEAQQNAETARRKLQETVRTIGDALNIDTGGGQLEDGPQKIAEKAKTLFQQDLLKSSELITLQDAFSQRNLETKASRETIMRLVSEVGREQKSFSETHNQLERLQKERDDAVFEKENMEKEIEILQERLDAREKAWSLSRQEMSRRQNKEVTTESYLKTAEHEKRLAQNELESFKASVAQALSDPYTQISPREDSIKDRIRELTAAGREKRSRIDDYELKVQNLSSQLERQCELHQDAIRRAKRAESDLYKNNAQQTRSFENEPSCSGALRASLRSDKQKFLDFVHDMREAMNVTEVTVDTRYNLNTDVLLARAKQLAKFEAHAMAENMSSDFRMHRKAKHYKDQLRNKDIHVDLLKKKVVQLEKQGKTRSSLAFDRDDAVFTMQKLSRKVDKLQKLLGDERAKNVGLRAELVETNNLKAITHEQRRRMEELQNTVAKLMTTKDRQRQRLTGLKKDLDFTNVEACAGKDRLRSQLDAVTGDLQSTKVAFGEISKRERQLINFREVVAKMLGLSVTSLAIPDYEIISRLEKLVKSHRLEVEASAVLDRSLSAMDPAFHAGYRSSKIDRTVHYSQPHPPHRSRSLSPGRYGRRQRCHGSRSPPRCLSPKRY